jgi:endo-1,4-beta-xylanase
MKYFMCFVLVIGLVALISGCKSDQPTSPVQAVQQEDGNLRNEHYQTMGTAGTGSDHGYFWTLYREGGSASITFPQAGTYAGNFAISYSGVNDVVGGKGWNPGSSSRVVHYNIGALSGSYNFVGVYGWTTSPLIEYYVAEKGSASGGSNVGTVSSDGHTYTLYKQQRVNAPSIQGTKTFWQYKSSWGGSSTGSNRQVTMSNHWNAWKSKMGSMGSPNYQVFALEAWGGKSGYINATVW